MEIERILAYSSKLFKDYDRYRIEAFRHRSFSPVVLQKSLHELFSNSQALLKFKTVGRSFEDRDILLVEIGNSNISVLLWSQMHGDESTATMAICDILNYFIKTKNEISTQAILTSLKLHFLPMLNPDGAERFQRRTAQGIDMNRDALTLLTPEARILKSLQDELKPRFGFNLHDQELSTVASTKNISAIGLLSPSLDYEKTTNDVRLRSKYLTAVFAQSIAQFIPGKITKYDDSFEPRAFGDNMQKWGTSTLLVESGHIPDDPQKDYVRKLNFVGILTALYGIATDTYHKVNIDLYENLPYNGKRAYDVIIRNIMIEHPSGNRIQADLGISYQVDTHSELPPKLIDLGDLSTFVGLKEIDGKEKVLPHTILTLNQAFEWQKYFS